MRKQQYIATVACLVAGGIGFVSVYATDKGKERREAEQEIAAQTQQEAPASYEVKPEISVEDATKKAEEQALKLAEQEKIKQEETFRDEGKTISLQKTRSPKETETSPPLKAPRWNTCAPFKTTVTTIASLSSSF